MIARNPDGSLSYTDQLGRVIRSNWQTYPLFSQMNEVYEKQQSAAQQDRRDVNDYLFRVGEWNENAKHPNLPLGKIPIKPKRTVIDDASGLVVAYVDYGPYTNGEGTQFPGPLPDVDKPTPANNPGDNKIAVPGMMPMPEMLELVLKLVTQMASDIAAIKVDIAAIKATLPKSVVTTHGFASMAPAMAIADPIAIAAHGPYEDLAIAGLGFLGKLVDGMTAEQKATVWQNWINFWQPLLDLGKKK